MSITISAPEAPDEIVALPRPVPAGTRVLHIGPPKTGTTAVQAAMHEARAALRDQGVRYLGRQRHSGDAVRSVLGRPSPRLGGKVPPGSYWQGIVGEARDAAEPRLIFSSEFLAGADEAAVERVVASFDPGSVHVVATFRPLARLLPSQWQQDVRRGAVEPFPTWLEKVLGPDPGAAPYFWRSHRFDAVVERWVRVVGPDRFTIIALDARDRGFMLRSFEALLALRPGTLVERPSLSNRSLTHPEAEAIRALNVAFRAAGLGWVDQAQLVHLGAARELWRRATPPGEPMVIAPAWAIARAAAIDSEMLQRVEALGVEIMGRAAADPLDGVHDPEALDAGASEPVTITPEVAAAMTMGVLGASGLVNRLNDRGERFWPAFRWQLHVFRVVAVGTVRGFMDRGREAITRRLPGTTPSDEPLAESSVEDE